LKKHSHIISVGLMALACLIAAREYYIGYELENHLAHELESMSASENDNSILDSEIGSLRPDTRRASSLFANAQLNLEKHQILQVNKGDTLGSLLTGLGISSKEIEHATKVLCKSYDVRDLKIGQSILVKYIYDEEKGGYALIEIDFKPNLEHQIVLNRAENGEFTVIKHTAQLKTVTRKVKGEIKASFYNSLLKQKIPLKIVHDAIKVLSYTVNFQHDIKKGDPYELLYEEHQDKDGTVVKTGDLEYISLSTHSHPHQLYRFTPPHSHAGYYTPKGESVIKALLQTPIDPKKMHITSKFGKRKHPILGFTRAHKGVDFGAAKGTAVMAAGSGVVMRAGYFGSFGKYIKVKHSGGYETEYAHLNKIMVHTGSHVQQGQVIGHVGETGLARGPHLHYGIILNGNHINPLTVKQLPTTRLTGKDLEKFKHEIHAIDKLIKELHHDSDDKEDEDDDDSGTDEDNSDDDDDNDKDDD